MTASQYKQGLKENWQQFTILVLVNAFVGGMVGMERSILPQFAEESFHVASKTAILGFIVAFGISKALANYYTGKWANKIGRRNLLIIGWCVAIPVPLLLLSANSWSWVLVANALLGISQGLTWSSTVVMKIDLVGEKQRGLAMGLNEFAGYLSVGLIAFLTAWIATTYGVVPYPFYLGLVLAVMGLFITLFFVKDTAHFLHQEQNNSSSTKLEHVFLDTSFRNKALSSITQAGLVNNLNDGMIWGLLPIWLLQQNVNSAQSAIITALYPIVWGLGQLFTGGLSDRFSKKRLLFFGMVLQGLAIMGFVISLNFIFQLFCAIFLGLGTALVYPTFLSSIAFYSPVQQRAETIGVFRLWRDLGYAIGALLSGIIADFFGIHYAIFSIAFVTLLSALVIQKRMPKD